MPADRSSHFRPAFSVVIGNGKKAERELQR
jgi:hypothetical protein